MQISDLALTLSKQYGLEALNGTNADAETRKTYATHGEAHRKACS